jgi:hypothetical protein
MTGLAIRQAEPAEDRCSCRYASTVQSLIGDCALVAGVGLAPNLNAAIDRVAQGLSPRANWRTWSKLCVDGAPVEICLHLARTPRAPSVSFDAGPYVADLPARIACALEVAALAVPEITPALARHRSAFDDPELLQIVRAVWLGLSLESPRSLRIYLSVREPGSAEVQLATLNRLARAFGVVPPRADQLRQLAAAGMLRACAFDISAQGVVGIKVSFALALADLERVGALARSCGVDAALLTNYITRFLRRGHGWRDRRCGFGVTLSNPSVDSDTVQAVTLYHPLQPYFGSDQAIRAAVISIIRVFDWDPLAFAALSQLVQDDVDGCAFQLAGFTLRRDGATGLSLYAGTGHVAR